MIKTGDNVTMLAGKDRGKTGKVLRVVMGDVNKVMVEGLNTVKRHQRARKQGQKGQIVTRERAVDVSNVQVICPKCGKATRIGHQLVAEKNIRVCKKCGAEL
ncbi:MAG: 50S ribosomal protein L24 [Patescibacteria group bacterium]